MCCLNFISSNVLSIFCYGALILNGGRLLNTTWINAGNSTVCIIQGSGEITQRILSGLKNQEVHYFNSGATEAVVRQDLNLF